MSNPNHPASLPGSRLPGIDRKAARVTWTAALTLLLLAAVYAIRETLVVFAVALLFAYLLFPLVDRIGRRFPPRRRGLALAATYLLVLGVVAAVVIGIGSHVVAEARQIVAQPPDLKGFIARLQLAHPGLSPALDAVQGRLRGQLSEMASAAPRVGLHVLAASANLIDLVITPILAFFMLKDGARIRDSFVARFPAGSARSEVQRAVTAVHTLLLNYMRALLLLCCFVFAVFSVVLRVMGVQYALLLSSIAFFCEFVPLLGPLTAAIVIIVVSALSGYEHLGWLIAFLGAFRVMQDYFVSPKLMSGGVALHPLLVIFGVFAGAEIGGVPGVFLSIPLLALARLTLDGVS